MVLKIVICTAVVIAALALANEVLGWRRGTRLVTDHQKAYRLTAGVVLEAVLIMILLHQAIARQHPVIQIYYWGVALILSFLLVALALLDVRETLVAYRERRREMYRRLLDGKRGQE